MRLAVDEIKTKPKKTCKILVQFDTSTMQQWHVQAPGVRSKLCCLLAAYVLTMND